MKNLAMVLMVLSASLCFGLTDSPDTVGLWHCDSIYEAGGKFYTPDDDSLMVGRNYDLELRNGVALASPGVDGTGSALDFDGVNDFGLKTWGQHDNARIDLAFKADTLTAGLSKYFLEVASIWRLYINNNNLLVMTVWDSAGTATTKNLTATIATGVWYKVEASYDSAGLFRLFLYDANDNILDGLEGIYGNGTMAKTAITNLILGAYRGTQHYFDGQIDEVKVSNYVTPEWTSPYVDIAGTVSALWHFDELADPNTSGVTSKLMPDDDSDNPGRNADMKLYSSSTGNVPVNNGASGGPSLVDPEVAGVGYPANNPAFGMAAYFDDPILVEGDSFRMLNADLSIDPTNVRVDCWIRPADELISYVPGVVVPYFIVDRWGQFYISLSQAANGALSISAMSFGSDGVNKAVTGQFTDPARWLNISYRFYQGTAQLYLNGSLVATNATLAASLMPAPSQTDFYIGKRYGSYANYFWGYMDEMKVSQAVYDVGCGAWGYLPGDLNGDCVVNELDLQILAAQWLETTEPSDPEAVEGVITQYESYNIPMAATTPTINGTLSPGEWADATTVFLGMPELTTAPNRGIYTDRIGATEPPTHENLSVRYFFKWDAQHLYVGLEVHDDILVFDDGYPDDHVNLALNLFRAGSSWPEIAFYNMYRDYFGNSVIRNQAGFNTNYNPVNAVSASVIQPYGWSYEVALKWSDFNGYTPTIGDVHGAVLMIVDNDAFDGAVDTFLWDSGPTDSYNLYKSVTLTAGIACGDTGYLVNDINLDCDVNLLDYAEMAAGWLGCSTPGADDCVDAR